MSLFATIGWYFLCSVLVLTAICVFGIFCFAVFCLIKTNIDMKNEIRKTNAGAFFSDLERRYKNL